jgi:F-type H+-transporting ATPase subunit gamma
MRPHAGRSRAEVLVVTSDRGLCGAFNANTLKRSAVQISQLESEGLREVVVSAVGRKAQEHLRKRRALAGAWLTGAHVEVAQAVQIAAHLARRYEAGEIDEAWVVVSEFVSALTQTPRAVRVLPFVPLESRFRAWKDGDDTEPPLHIEPDERRVLETLVPVAFEFVLYQMLLENQASEHAARMTAMEAATRNTEELIASLTLKYNRARQAAITKELVEIVSGAEALA